MTDQSREKLKKIKKKKSSEEGGGAETEVLKSIKRCHVMCRHLSQDYLTKTIQCPRCRHEIRGKEHVKCTSRGVVVLTFFSFLFRLMGTGEKNKNK